MENFKKTFFYETIKTFGGVFLHLYDTAKNLKPFRFKELIKQIEFVGNKSIFIISITGLFVGFAFSYQTWLGLGLFDMKNIVGTIVALGIFRDLGPVMTGIILSARAGGAMSAKLGAMVISNQTDVLEIMGVSKTNYLVQPRILASTLTAPILTIVFNVFAMISCYILAVLINNLDQTIFFEKTLMWLSHRDVFESLLKSSIFGFEFSLICTFYGLKTGKNSLELGHATSSAIVSSIICIIVSDYFISKIFGVFWGFL